MATLLEYSELADAAYGTASAINWLKAHNWMQLPGSLGLSMNGADNYQGYDAMTMSMTELERSLRALRLSGMTATLENRALQVAQQQMDFIEAFSALVQDELDLRRSRLIERRFSLSGLPERKDLKAFDWQFNPKLPKRDILELAALKFIDEREDALFIGSPGVGKSHADLTPFLVPLQVRVRG